MMNILILEDDPRFSREFARMLRDHEFSATEADTIAKAKEALKSKKVDGVVIDIKLRHEHDEENKQYGGFNFARYLQNNHNVPFIFLTQNFDDPNYSEIIQEMGLSPSLLFGKNQQLVNESVFIAALLSAFEHHFVFPEKKLAEVKNQIQWKLGFYVNDEDEGTYYDFISADEVMYFTGINKNVEIFTTRPTQIKKYSAHLKLLIPKVENRWSNFVKLGATYYVNAEKISRFRRLADGRGYLRLWDKETGVSYDLTIAASGVATLYSLGLIISTER